MAPQDDLTPEPLRTPPRGPTESPWSPQDGWPVEDPDSVSEDAADWPGGFDPTAPDLLAAFGLDEEDEPDPDNGDFWVEKDFGDD